MNHEPDHSSPPQARIIPLPIAVGILVSVFLAGAAGIAWWFRRPPSSKNAINAITPEPGNARVARTGRQRPSVVDPVMAANEAHLPDGAYEQAEGGLLIKAGDAYARFKRIENTDRLRNGFYTLSDEQWEHGYLSEGAGRMLADAGFARKLRVTASQIEQLRALPPAPGDWAEDDRRKLLDGYAAWRAATGPKRLEAARELVGMVKVMAPKKQATDRPIVADRIARMRAILTPAQVQALNPIPTWDFPGTKKAEP